MKKPFLFVWVLISLLFVSADSCLGMPSENFRTIKGEVYDDWNICRTRSLDNDGFFQVLDKSFRPALAFQSLGGLKDIAWRIGERLAESYSGNELARRIFSCAKDNVVYTSDSIQFGFSEFARNADEIAKEIEVYGYSRGDCEDYAVLLAVMFKAAGFRSALVLAPGHAATLVHLPDYPGANAYWEFKGEKGWIWAEATGRENPLGWTPPKFMRSDLLAYEITEEPIIGKGESEFPKPGDGGIAFGGSFFFPTLFWLWFLPRLRRR